MIKKRILLFLFIFVLVTLPVSGIEQGENVYVIKIHGEINSAMHQYLQQSLKTVGMDPNAKAVIVEVDTYGGLINAAVDIGRTIVNTDIHTISFVNTKAESAGVLITISADNIVMAPGGTIGSAEPVPNTEKILSFWAGELRTVAQQKGRDPQLVASMADSSIEIPGVIERGRLLNLTSLEAKELDFLDAVASDYSELLDGLNISYSNIIEMEIPFRVKLAQILTSSYMMTLLLSLGFIGIVFELLTPGFGVGGTVAFVAFALYFGGSILAGYAGGGIIIIFLTGIVLLTIEAFAPGFGIPGVGGIISIVVSIVLAADSVATAVTSLFIAFVLTIVAIVLILKYAPKHHFFDKIVLKTSEKPEYGYLATKTKLDHLVGEIGIVKTFLRPAGTVELNGELLDVVSEGDYIESGTTVKVIKVEGRRIIVRKID